MSDCGGAGESVISLCTVCLDMGMTGCDLTVRKERKGLSHGTGRDSRI
jgi:hypothetical protein